MANNLIMKEGRYQEWTVASKSSGDPVLNGAMTGVAITDSDSTTNKLRVDMAGVYDLSVKAIDDDGNSAISVGSQIYYVDADTPKLSKKKSGYFFGFALEAISSGQTDTIKVLQIMGTGPGTADIVAEAITLALMADLARGSLISGQTASNRPTALDAKGDGKILVGDGTDINSVAVSGDVTMDNTGAVTIAAGAVEFAMLAAAAKGLEVAISDPGDAQAIPVTTSGVCAITTAAGETRTLAIPSKVGQKLVLTLDVDGGDCVITVAAAFNQTGNNTITMADAGDTVVLVATQVGGSLVWRVMVNDGATLSTV